MPGCICSAWLKVPEGAVVIARAHQQLAHEQHIAGTPGVGGGDVFEQLHRLVGPAHDRVSLRQTRHAVDAIRA